MAEAVTVAAVAAEAAALTRVGVAASDEPMAQADEPMAADEVDEDGWPIYNNPVASVSSASFLDEHAHGPPTQEPPPSEPTLEAMELDEATLAVVNPSTQGDALMASPAERRKLLQPTSSELTPGGVNLLH